MDGAVADLLLEGLVLLVIGMSIVVTFLLALIGILKFMSFAVHRWAPDTAAAAFPAYASAASPPGITDDRPLDDRRLVAAIAAAVTRYRHRSSSD